MSLSRSAKNTDNSLNITPQSALVD